MSESNWSTASSDADLGKLFGMNEEMERDGVNIQFGPLKISLARMGGSNTKFAKVFEELTRPYRRMIENNVDLPEDIMQEILFKSFAIGCVRSWNLRDADGKPVPCTPDNVVDRFKKYPEFYRFVSTEAARSANYRQRALETESGN